MKPHERLKALRKAAGLSQDALAKRAHTTQQTINRLELGPKAHNGRRLTVAWLERLGKVLSVEPGAFLSDTGPFLVPLFGYVGAGDEIYPLDGDVERVEAPPGLGADGAALEVRGESMVPRLQPGDRVFYRQRELAPSEAVGHVCIVHLEDGPLLIKRIARGSKRGLFDLASYNRPEVLADRRLAWAARLAWIRCSP